MTVTTTRVDGPIVRSYRSWTELGQGQRRVQLISGLLILAVIVLASAFAPVIAPHDPGAQDPSHALLGFSRSHLLGTDDLGRDVLSRLLFGARLDLAVAVAAVLAPFVIGVTVGTVCGYVGGLVDATVMRIADVVVAFPFYVLVIALVFVLGSGPRSIFIAISVVSWVAYARILRAEAMLVRERDFIAAGRTGGLSHLRILVRHVLPNIVSQAIVYAMSDIVLNIGLIVTLSYFGLGIQPPTPDLGAMMAEGQQFLAAGDYSLTLIPACVVILSSLGLSLVGEGLTHVLTAKR